MGTSERKTSCHPLTLSRNGTPDWEFQLGPARFQIRPARFQIGKIPDRAATYTLLVMSLPRKGVYHKKKMALTNEL